MALVISQNTFDQTVRENVEELGMTPEEATEDAIQQFRAQGVDLSNIITEPNMVNQAKDELSTCLGHLAQLTDQNGELASVEEDLAVIRKWCNKGIPFRVLAGSLKIYDSLINALNLLHKNVPLTTSIFNTLISLMTGYPDLLDRRGIEVLSNCLQTPDVMNSRNALVAALHWIQECCKKHERNRQELVTQNIHEIIPKLLREAEESPAVLIEVCELIKLLTFDDDIREEVSKAHEHARILAVNNLCLLCELLEKMKNNVSAVPHILGALSALIVRNEFCEKVDSAGGIRHIYDILATYPDVEKINTQCLRLMKALAGNDDVKGHLMDAGAAPLLLSAMARHKANAFVTHAGCGCIAALALRSPGNSKILVENGAADALVDALKLHEKAPNIQKAACLGIRNIVARDKTLCCAFLSLGVEELLNNVDKTLCWDEAKAALRDLNCNVKLDEPFTGKGVKLRH